MTREEALKLYETKFWENISHKEIVEFQLFERRLCMPFSVFHKAVEEVLERPVYTHEFGLNQKGLEKEFLGERPAPTPEEIMNLIPEEKRIVVFT